MRVIGLPKEKLSIRNDGIYIGDSRLLPPDKIKSIRYAPTIEREDGINRVSYPYLIPDDSYFLVGDNTSNSFDSRFWGALPMPSILGRVTNK